MTIADRIKERRELLHLTQEELANKCGYSDKSSITKIEKSGNDITLKKIQKVAKALGTTPSYLMGWDESDDEYTLTGEVDPETMKEAMNLYSQIVSLPPDFQDALLNMLKSLQNKS